MDRGEEYQLKIIQKLIEAGYLKKENEEKFISLWRDSGKHITGVILDENEKNPALFMNEMDLLSFIAKVTGTISYDPKFVTMDPALIKNMCYLLPAKYQRDNLIFFRSKEGATTIGLGMVNPYDEDVISEVGCFTGCQVVPYACHENGLRDAYETKFPPELYDEESDCKSKMANFDLDAHFIVCEDLVNENWNYQDPAKAIEELIIKNEIQLIVQIIFHRAMSLGASDFHFEPVDGAYRLRCRMDGVLKVMWKFSEKLGIVINGRIKSMCCEPTHPYKHPKDARIAYNIISGKKLEYRVSILPVIGGDKIVMRAIDSTAEPVSLDIMGFTDESLKKFRKNIWAPQGVVLITGPTGSGKTTTLYSVVHERNDDETSITTAEDPVEANIQGVAQVQCKEGGVTFAMALKAFLRQDPEIILIGEIRNKETAEMAFKAGMTGHLVLSTLHTNDAPSTINRLINMDIAPFLIASGVNLVHAQRLVRKVCPNCKKEVTYSDEVFEKMSLEPEEIAKLSTFYEGEGCEKCDKTGLKGRMGLFEVLDLNDAVKEVILAKGNTFDITEAARNSGFMTLREDGFLKVTRGETSLKQVVSATM